MQTDMEFYYSVYGQLIYSNRMLLGLIELEAHASTSRVLMLKFLDIADDECLIAPEMIYFKSEYLDAITGEPLIVVSVFEGNKQYLYKSYEGVSFIIDPENSCITISLHSKVSLETATAYLLGPVLGFYLRLINKTCLHASVVNINGQAVAFVGEAGAGKSTLAAAFARQGYAILTEDVAALEENSGFFQIQPGYPRIRLWPESVEIFYGSAHALPRIAPADPYWDKRYLDLTEDGYRFEQHALPLAAIYLLQERRPDPDCPKIEDALPNESLMSLITNTYRSELLDRVHRAEEFKTLGKLIKQVPVKKITSHTEHNHIYQLCKLITNDIGNLQLRHINAV